MSPFKVLGITKYSAEDEIRIAYKRLLKKHHPDTGDGDRKKLDDIRQAFTDIKKIQSESGSIITVTLNVKVSEEELDAMRGTKSGFRDDIMPDIHYIVTVPKTTRLGDTILVKNIINNTNLKINFLKRI
ncbi:MAG: J domain-containing protein [Candidatus Endolissoclinum sp.]|nr:J domain-containing protein [Candidatus Endolissoclinum sp.]